MLWLYWYYEIFSGFLGLFRDDIISENDPVIQEALKRLSDKEAFDRTFRLRRAIQLNLNHDVLPLSEQTKPGEVKIIWNYFMKFYNIIWFRMFLIFGNMLKQFVKKEMRPLLSIMFNQQALKTSLNPLRLNFHLNKYKIFIMIW